MITSDDEELMNELQVLSLHGMSKNAWNRYSDKGTWFYEIESPGYKYNMTDIQASLGIVQLGKLEEMQTLRRKVAHQYQTSFSEVEQLQVPHDDPKHRHAWHLYPIRLKGDTLKIGRDEFIEKLKEAGIGTSVHFIPIPIHPFYKKLGYKIADYHHTLKAYEGVISLPLFPGMTEKQTEYVIQQVLNLVDQYKK